MEMSIPLICLLTYKDEIAYNNTVTLQCCNISSQNASIVLAHHLQYKFNTEYQVPQCILSSRAHIIELPLSKQKIPDCSQTFPDKFAGTNAHLLIQILRNITYEK